AAKVARAYRRALFDIARSLGEGQAALIVSHSGVVEGSVMACLTEVDGIALGRGVGYCEGVRLIFEQDGFVAAEILRVGATIRIKRGQPI
ncbi:MAG: hypothetical protein ABIQ99_13385, partial [Thermoflexales bacterium]